MTYLTTRIAVSSRIVLVFFLTSVILSACVVKFVSDYDQVLDSSITALQIDTEAFFGHLKTAAGTADASYNTNKAFYINTRARLEALKMRAQATPQNSETAEQVDLLIDSFDTLRQLHEESGDAGLTATQLVPVHTSLEVIFRAIITLEIAKKRGKS